MKLKLLASDVAAKPLDPWASPWAFLLLFRCSTRFGGFWPRRPYFLTFSSFFRPPGPLQASLGLPGELRKRKTAQIARFREVKPRFRHKSLVLLLSASLAFFFAVFPLLFALWELLGLTVPMFLLFFWASLSLLCASLLTFSEVSQ